MNGREHYREAERLVAIANHAGQANPGLPGEPEHDGIVVELGNIIAAAQVHATLATVSEETMRMWDSLREHFLRRITEDEAVDTFRRVWAEADARGESGDRVRQALAAVVSEVLL